MSHPEKIIKEFEERFLPSSIGQHKQVRDFLLTSHLEYLQKSKKRLESELNNKEHICRFNDGEQNCDCWNFAITSELEIIRKEIKETEKMR